MRRCSKYPTCSKFVSQVQVQHEALAQNKITDYQSPEVLFLKIKLIILLIPKKRFVILLIPIFSLFAFTLLENNYENFSQISKHITCFENYLFFYFSNFDYDYKNILLSRLENKENVSKYLLKTENQNKNVIKWTLNSPNTNKFFTLKLKKYFDFFSTKSLKKRASTECIYFCVVLKELPRRI